MSQDIDRRRFLGAAAAAIAATQLGGPGSASAQPRETARAGVSGIEQGAGTSFGPLKQIDAGVLNVGYAEAGPANGRAVLLLHGWPYDIYSYVDVAPVLAAAGYRVIVPYLRGYGTTRFLSSATLRNGQQAAVALDAIALLDALRIEKAIVAGFDWGARTADIVAALRPERCKALVSVSGYLIGSPAANKAPLPPTAEGAPSFGDRSSHQMDCANAQEAMREVHLDVEEGADMLMVKPAHTYLDVICRIKQAYPYIPLGAYHTSGEFSMIKAAGERGWIDEKRAALEVLRGIRRAGADFIITYFAKEFAQWQRG